MTDSAPIPESASLPAAIAAGDLAGVRAALAAGASAVAPNSRGDPPLLVAVVGGDSRIVRLLLEAGANPNQAGAAGETPLVLAARIDAPVLEWIAPQGGQAPAGRFAPVLESLIEHGADLRTSGPEAARYGVLNSNLATLEVLDRHELAWTDPDHGAGQTELPLSASLLALAVHQRNEAPMVRFLCRRPGSRVRGPEGGALVRSWAQRPGGLDLEVLETLLSAGAAADGPDEAGMTPLMYVAARGNGPACARLLAAGADPSRRDGQGRRALEHAAGAEDLSALAVLRGREKEGERQAVQAATFAPGQRLVCLPWGTPPVLQVELSADSLASALAFVEERWGWSRARIGPFPVLRVVSADGAERGPNPGATQTSALIRVGDMLVLTLLTPRRVAARHPGTKEEPQGERLLVAGRFSNQREALAALDRFRGWSLVVEVEALPQMEDGYPGAADVWHAEPFPGNSRGRR